MGWFQFRIQGIRVQCVRFWSKCIQGEWVRVQGLRIERPRLWELRKRGREEDTYELLRFLL